MNIYNEISYKIRQVLNERKTPVDMVGNFIKVGDTVLTKGHSSADKDSLGTVVRLNKKSITVALDVSEYDYKEGKRIITKKTILRDSADSLIVNSQFEEQITKNKNTLMEEYPEAFI